MLKTTSFVTVTRPPMITTDEQTRLSWARLIPSFEQLPDQFRAVYPYLQQPATTFPHCVVTPPYTGFLTGGVEQLVFMQDLQLFVIRLEMDKPQQQVFRFDDIDLVEFQSVLLDAYFNLHGIDQTGQSSTLSIHFNSVTDYLFFPFLNAIRENGRPKNGIPDPAQFESLSLQSFKFANYARRSLLPGETILKMIWQPESRFNFFKKLIPLVFRSKRFHESYPNHLILLTDRELIMIHDLERQPGKSHYGGLWQYLPLQKIQKTTITEQENGLIRLSLTVQRNKAIDCLYSQSQKKDLDELLEVLHSLNRKMNHSST